MIVETLSRYSPKMGGQTVTSTEKAQARVERALYELGCVDMAVLFLGVISEYLLEKLKESS